MKEKNRRWLFALVVSIITLLAYLPSLQNDFVNWDDPEYVYDNPHIRDLNFESAVWMLTSFHAANWHPLTWFSHALDYALWGLNPLGHHLTSVLLHGLNTLLVVVVITRLIQTGQGRASEAGQDLSPLTRHSLPESPLMAGGIAGLLFGLHPLHVESVGWVSERKDVLYALFYLLSIFMYLRYVSSQRGKRLLFYSLCLGSFLLSLMSKPMAVTLPAVLLLLDVYPLGRLNVMKGLRSVAGVIAEKLVFFGLSLASSVLTVQAQESAGAIKPLITILFWDRVLIALRALAFYLYKILWPLHLAPLYPFPRGVSVFGVEYIFSIALFIMITIFCVYSWKKQKIWTVAWGYFLITVLPVLGIIKVGDQAAADRYMYLPSLGPFLVLGIAGARAMNVLFRGKRQIASPFLPAGVFLVVVTALLFPLTVNQQKIWKDSVTLWRHELKYYPDTAYQAYYNLGNAYDSLGLFNDAIEQYRNALKVNPYYLDTYNTLGALYQSQGLIDEAIEQYQMVIRLRSDFPTAHYNLGLAYQSQGRIDEAIDQYQQVLKLSPEHVDARYNLGGIYQSRGLIDEAIEQYELVLRIDPLYVRAQFNLGNTYQSQGLLDKSIEAYREVIRRDPLFFEAFSNLGISYMMKGALDEAVLYVQEAITINPSHPRLYYNLGRIYQSKGENDEAMEQYRAALKIRPDYAEAHYNLAVVYQSQGLHENARVHYDRARKLKPSLFPGGENQH